MSEQYLDKGLLAELRGILEAEFPVLIRTYIQDSTLRVNELEQAFTRGDIGSVRTLAHSLKGSSANLGLIYLAELCATLEDAARAGQIAGQEPGLQRLAQEQRHAVELLNDYL
jgi:HPt (histidine-containing phosphotransfer) domain-containing protein